jgi:hypothetical protein
MARAVHRLALLVLPGDPDLDPARIDALIERWVEEERLKVASHAWEPGSAPLVEGGFRRARVERFDRVRFVSSGLGGFRVTCPDGGGSVVEAFDRAHSTWVRGGPRTLTCRCGREHDLAALGFAPEAGFARAWIALQEVEGLDLAAEARRGAEQILGTVHLVARRG